MWNNLLFVILGVEIGVIGTIIVGGLIDRYHIWIQEQRSLKNDARLWREYGWAAHRAQTGQELYA